MSDPRRHHYLPRFYLAGFTDKNTRDSRLFVVDKSTGRQFSSSPADAAHQRDFFRIEGDDGDPFELERKLAETEAEISPFLVNVHQTKTLPNAKGLDRLLQLIAMIKTRVPHSRRRFDTFIERIGTSILHLSVTSKERWDLTLARMRRIGYEVPETVTFEEMRQFVDEGKFRVEASQNWHLDQFIRQAEQLHVLLRRRHWGLVVAEAGTQFVCSDNPVVLRWRHRVGNIFGPGWALPGTIAVLPIGIDLALWGTFEPLPNRITVPRQVVASVNSIVIMQAERFFYSGGKEIAWEDHKGAVQGIKDYQDLLASKK